MESSNYPVKLRTAPSGHVIPPLLLAFAGWAARQPYGCVGWFEILAAPVPGGWGPSSAKRLRQDAWCFASLPDGSLLALLDAKRPAPVVRFGGEGEAQIVAPSLEAFLLALAVGKTSVPDLDEDERSRRRDLAAWLKTRDVKAPAAAGFDFEAYLASDRPAALARKRANLLAKLPPEFRGLVELIGRRLDDPTLARDLTAQNLPLPKVLKAGVVSDHRRGINVILSAQEVTEVTLDQTYRGPLPFQLSLAFNDHHTRKLLGNPTRSDKGRSPSWDRALDEQRGLFFTLTRPHFGGAQVRLFLKKA